MLKLDLLCQVVSDFKERKPTQFRRLFFTQKYITLLKRNYYFLKELFFVNF